MVKSILKTHNLNNYPDELQDLFHFMSISSNFDILGSSQYKNFIFNSDYDLNDHYKSKHKTYIRKVVP